MGNNKKNKSVTLYTNVFCFCFFLRMNKYNRSVYVEKTVEHHFWLWQLSGWWLRLEVIFLYNNSYFLHFLGFELPETKRYLFIELIETFQHPLHIHKRLRFRNSPILLLYIHSNYAQMKTFLYLIRVVDIVQIQQSSCITSSGMWNRRRSWVRKKNGGHE